jgi:hypothetical protein
MLGLLLLTSTGLSGCSDAEGVAPRTADACNSFKFDEKAWESLAGPDDDGLTPRQRIADDLIRCRVLDGMRHERVRSMLGPPDERDRGELQYMLGDERGAFKLDAEYLRIVFDSSRRVASVDLSVG